MKINSSTRSTPLRAYQLLTAAYTKLYRLMGKLHAAEIDETRILNKLGLGYAQRIAVGSLRTNVKVGFSTRKTDGLKQQIKEQEEKIIELRAIKYTAEQCEDVVSSKTYTPSEIKYLIKCVWLDGFRQNDNGQ
jgi:hypothetical protein